MNIYKEITDEYFKLYQSFIESGFSEEQAFELTKEYCRSTVANNMVNYGKRYETRYFNKEVIKERIGRKHGLENLEIKEEKL